MKTILQKSAAIILLLISSISSAQQNNFNEELIKAGIMQAEKAYLMYDVNLFLQAKETFEKALALDNSNILALYYSTYCEYKLLEMSMRKGNEYLFDKYYEGAVVKAEKIASSKEMESEGKTLLAAIYMMKIAHSSLSAVTLSPKIHSLLDQAQTLDKNNPRSYIIRGIMKYQTPGIFGGSYEDAMKNFTKAIILFEKQDETNSLQPNWGYMETLAWLGKSQEKLNNYDAAKFAYQKALSLNADFTWVKYSLLPELEEKIKNKN